MTAAVQQGWWPSWQLFGDAILVGLALGAVLPVLGVVLVLRQQMFVTAAIGQAANLGIATIIWLGAGATHGLAHGTDSGETGALLGGLGFAVAATVLALRALSRSASTLEASSVWVFVAGGSGAMVLLADVPHGLAEVQRLMLSSLLCVGPGDVYVVGGFALALVLAIVWWPRRLALWAMDPQTAAAYGTPAWRCDLVVGAFGGALLGWSIYTAGLVFTFACAMLPVLAARELAGSLRGVLGLSPALGALGVAAGYAVAHRCDLPAGQTSAVVLVAAVVVARIVGFTSRRR